MTSPAETTTAAPTATEAAVLGLLAVGGELSGYELHRCARYGVGYVWAPARSRIYAALPRLVAEGWVERRDVVQSSRPDKQLHRITPAGDRALREWLETDGPPSGDEFLLRVFFGDLMAPEVLERHVGRHLEHAEARLAEYEQIEPRIEDDAESFYGYLTLRYGLASARAQVAWAQETLERLAR